ncbi:MAG: hypothetical protein HKN23_05785 [Verrucomicrobiales bacterium]|nr:hypothetical protein [Verrucomicrobiales bacterium]
MKGAGSWAGKFCAKHPWLIRFGVAFVVLALIAAIVGVAILSGYYRKAANYDLSSVSALEVGSLALDRNGNQIGRISLQDRLLVDLEQVPQHLIEALLATEDSRFRRHNGFDLKGIARAAVQNVKAGTIRQGGSTITQQLARHAFSLRGRTFDRKLTELFLARRIEASFTKDEILESYLNRIYLGSGYWGVGAAARGYFDKDVKDLDVTESATLCALIKSPNRFSPYKDPQASVEARNRTLKRMADLGYIEESERIALSGKPSVALPESDRVERPRYLLTKIREEALSILHDRQQVNDLVIETSVDFALQDKTIDIVDRALRLIESREGYSHPVPWAPTENESSGPKVGDDSASPFLQAAVAVVENETGQVVAAVGGRNFRESQFNRAWDAKRAPGSAFLPFLYAAAYESGKVSPITTLLDAPIDNRRIMIGGEEGVLGEWSTESTDETYLGNISAVYALTKSKNSAAARMALENLTPTSVAEFAGEAGLDGEYPEFPSTYLGTAPVNLIDLVRAYTAFPNQGKAVEKSRLITRITTGDGRVLYEKPRFTPRTICSPLTAKWVHESLKATFSDGTATPWSSEISRLKAEVAGKSGTSYEFKDNWFIGYNGRYTWGVWIGFDRPTTIYPHAFGSDTALPIWMEIAEHLDEPIGFQPLHTPSSHPICYHTGCIASEHCRTIELPLTSDEWKLVRDEAAVCPVHGKPGYRMTSRKTADPVESETETTDIPRARPLGRSVTPRVPVVAGDDPWEALNPNREIKIE